MKNGLQLLFLFSYFYLMDLKIHLVLFSDDEIGQLMSVLSKEYPNLIASSSNLEDLLLNKADLTPDILLLNEPCKIYSSEEIENAINQKNYPIIIFSGINNNYQKIDSGAVLFIEKPYSNYTIKSAIKSAINLKNILDSNIKKEIEINKKNEEIRQQMENAINHRDIISRQNKEIMADIRYASRIQHAILPRLEYMSDLFPEYFILHQPKSHVSGDFYWASTHQNKKILAVGDCTGHGLSGALMHMLGAVYLNDIIVEGNFKTASDVLDQLRDRIMKSLQQTGSSGEAQDGLDIALCIIDLENNQLQFSGANNPLYIIRKDNLTEIRGDRMPVGIHINFDKPFTNHIVDIAENDQVYLFSDGYADQFGGPKGKKFRYNQFKELLIEISSKPMDIQKEILNNVHDQWRGSSEQIDDILVFGLKIK